MSHWIPEGVLVGVLAVAAITDLRSQRVPNWLTLPAIAAGFVLWPGVTWAAGDGAAAGLKTAGLGFLVGFVPLLVAFLLGGVGGGDAKLGGAIGALAGPYLAMLALLYGFLLAGLLAAAVMIRKRIVRRTMGRIWRFLWLFATGARPASPTEPGSPRIANALPWAVGTVWAIAERSLHVSLIGWLIGR